MGQRTVFLFLRLKAAFRPCGCGSEYAQASEEACLQRPSLWQKEGLVGPQ